MAAEGEVTDDHGKGTVLNDVITLSSDEEGAAGGDSDDVDYLFDRFTLACRKFVNKQCLGIARDTFKSTPRDHACSKTIKAKLRRATALVNGHNANTLIDNLCKSLKSDKCAVLNGVSADTNSSCRSEGNERKADVGDARNFNRINGNTSEIKTTASQKLCTEISDDDSGDFEGGSKLPGKTPSRADARADKTKIATRTMSDKQRKKMAMKLQLRLKQLSQQIKILNKAELTLDEMEMADSNYIKENLLKKKFDKTWNKLCKVLGRPPKTGRVIEKPVHPSKTGNHIIDRAIENFLRDRPGKFPNYFDIRDVVEDANKKHDLRMSPQVMKEIIRDVFTDIGNKMQRLREKDLLFNFGSHLLDDFKTEHDPALQDDNLLQRLEQNKKVSKRNLKKVYSKFTRLERFGKRTGKESGDDSDDVSTAISTDNDTDSDKVDSPHHPDSSEQSSSAFSTSMCTHRVPQPQRVVEYVSLLDDDESVDTTLTPEQPCTVLGKDGVSQSDITSSQDSMFDGSTTRTDNLSESGTDFDPSDQVHRGNVGPVSAIEIENKPSSKDLLTTIDDKITADEHPVRGKTAGDVKHDLSESEVFQIDEKSIPPTDSCTNKNAETVETEVSVDVENSTTGADQTILHSNVAQNDQDDDCCIIIEETKVDAVIDRKPESSKRKRPGDICEKIVTALKSKRLKLPNNMVANKDVTTPSETLDKLTALRNIILSCKSEESTSNHVTSDRTSSAVTTSTTTDSVLTDMTDLDNVNQPSHSTPVGNCVLKLSTSHRRKCSTPLSRATIYNTTLPSPIRQNGNEENGAIPDIIIIDD